MYGKIVAGAFAVIALVVATNVILRPSSLTSQVTNNGCYMTNASSCPSGWTSVGGNGCYFNGACTTNDGQPGHCGAGSCLPNNTASSNGIVASSNGNNTGSSNGMCTCPNGNTYVCGATYIMDPCATWTGSSSNGVSSGGGSSGGNYSEEGDVGGDGDDDPNACENDADCNSDQCENALCFLNDDPGDNNEHAVGCVKKCNGRCTDGVCGSGYSQCNPNECPGVCGDGLLSGQEQCDDGNTANNDGCSASCVPETCGDGTTQNSGQPQASRSIVASLFDSIFDFFRGDPDTSDDIRKKNPDVFAVTPTGSSNNFTGPPPPTPPPPPSACPVPCAPGCTCVDVCPAGVTCVIGYMCQCPSSAGPPPPPAPPPPSPTPPPPAPPPPPGPPPAPPPPPTNPNCDGTCNAGHGACMQCFLQKGSTQEEAKNRCDWLCRDDDGPKKMEEECDDGNDQSNDGCSASCKKEYCGDGIVQNGDSAPQASENLRASLLGSIWNFFASMRGGSLTAVVNGPQLELTKAAPSNGLFRGQNAQYTFTIKNVGASTATNVRVYDYFLNAQGIQDETLTFVSGSVNCTDNDPQYPTFKQVMCFIGNMPAGFSKTFTITFSVPQSLACNQVVKNRADGWINGNPTEGNDTMDAQTTINCSSPPPPAPPPPPPPPPPKLTEECDDGNTKNGDGCNAQCKKESKCPTMCNTCASGGEQCKFLKGSSPTQYECFNGVRQGWGSCDCSQCSGGSSSSTSSKTLCGNGVRDYGEECDNGPANSMTNSQCRPDCTLMFCGDGVIDDAYMLDAKGNKLISNPLNEQCDCGKGKPQSQASDGSGYHDYDCEVEFEGKKATCTYYCYVQFGCFETGKRTYMINTHPCFENGVYKPGPGCPGREEICSAGDKCGNKKVDAGEQCDMGSTCVKSKADCSSCPANQRDTCCGQGDSCAVNSELTPGWGETYCTSTCKEYTVKCGNGVLNESDGEQCDKGASFFGNESALCREGCYKPICGDEVVDKSESKPGQLTGFSETCDVGLTCTGITDTGMYKGLEGMDCTTLMHPSEYDPGTQRYSRVRPSTCERYGGTCVPKKTSTCDQCKTTEEECSEATPVVTSCPLYWKKVCGSIGGKEVCHCAVDKDNDRAKKLKPFSKVPVSADKGMTALVSGDFNGDGRMDIVLDGWKDVATRREGRVYMAAQRADRSYAPSTAVLIPYAHSEIAKGDLNGDGKLDLISAGRQRRSPNDASAKEIYLHMGKGDGTFVGAMMIGVPGSAAEPHDLRLVDLNGDGRDDIVVNVNTGDSDGGPPTLGGGMVLINKGNLTFQAPIVFPGKTIRHVADLNMDNKKDLVTTGTDSIYSHLGKGDGTFAAPILSVPYCAFAGAKMKSGDLNNDGKTDLVLYDSMIQLLEGKGDGTFKLKGIYKSISPSYVEVADVACDGNQDIVINDGSSQLGVMAGRGNGTFEPGLTPTDGGGKGGLIISDMDSDTDSDVVLLNASDGSFTVHQNTCVPNGGSSSSGGSSESSQGPVSHAECINSMCVSVTGPGPNECTIGQVCTPKHLSCSGNACMIMDGEGPDACLVDADCCTGPGCTPQHLACVNNACTLIPGEGTDNCTACQPIGEHLECVNSACTIASGAGPNECNSSADCCTGAGCTPKHLDCVSNACTLVSGGGADLCDSNADCVPTDSHGECLNGMCVAIPGQGLSECTIGEACVPTHLDCVNSACTPVNGDGPNLCQTDEECSPTHLACVGNACMLVNGPGPDACIVDAHCCTGAGCNPQHLACVNNACSLVSGGGPDLCTSDANCGGSSSSGGVSHTECQNSMCVSVAGAGTNQCTTNTDCTGGSSSSGGVSHTICQNSMCVSVAGAGTDQCASNANCCTGPGCNPTHLECFNNTCTAASGAGPNTCDTNQDCCVGPNCTTSSSSSGGNGEACGNGTLDANEQCDDGNIANGDGCSALCAIEPGTQPRCGDNILTQGEECDDGNVLNGDGCSATCSREPGVCGNGILNDNETCDDANRINNDGCSADCRIEPGVTPRCGDNIITDGEDCDDGNLQTGDGCGVTCQNEQGACGDNILHANEECEDGNLNNNDGCSSACRLEGNPTFCGDRIKTAGEDCDDGNLQNGDGCSRTCQNEPTCGNYQLDATEECDDGNTQNGDLCSATCHLEQNIATQCGDGTITVGEQCDDGNFFNGDGCNMNCKKENIPCKTNTQCGGGVCIKNICQPKAPTLASTDTNCGNRILEPRELCEDGNKRSGDGCSASCTLEAGHLSRCGDAIMIQGEECDDANSRDFDGCSSDCFLESGRCGDGILQRLLGEQCEATLHDPALPYRCGTDCRNLSLFCGNATLDPGEECDNGVLNNDRVQGACRTNCSAARCGDGTMDAQETCDDGNRLSGDGCDRFCRREGFGAAPGVASNILELPTLPGVQSLDALRADLAGQQGPLGSQASAIATGHAPAGETGPAAIAVMAAGAASGLAWVRRKRRAHAKV